MMNLAEYRRTAARLADYLPWAALVGEGVVLNKDGSFQRSARFRGPDLFQAGKCFGMLVLLCPASDAVRLKRIALSRPSVLAYAISIMGSRGVHSAWSPPRRGVGRDQRHGVSDMRSTGPSVFRSP